MPPAPPLLVRAAMRVARARWYAFLRRLLRHHHRDDELNPFDSPPWLALLCAATLLQIAAAAAAAAVAAARGDRAAWPVKTWVAGYTLSNLLSLPLLLLRLRRRRRAAPPDPEATGGAEETDESWEKAERARTFLDLFCAVWFVLGNIWLLDSRQGPQGVLYHLGMVLLVWNAVVYSLPFLVFLLLRCCIPLAGAAIGYDINLAADDRGASDDDLARLPSFLFQHQAEDDPLLHSDIFEGGQECCICLAKYKAKEELRELPCSHQFHLRCVDQWLKIIALCPLCKKELDR